MTVDTADRTATLRPSGEPLAILAGGGVLPAIVAAAAEKAGRPVMILGIDGEAGEEITGFPHHWIKWGQFGRAENLIQAHGAREIVLVGAIRRRPNFRRVRFDALGLKSLPRILALFIGGDNSMLSGAVKFIEGRGYRVLGAHEIARDLVAEPGLLTRRRPSDRDRDDIERAAEAARTIGRLDVGQAAVSIASHVVALEGAEGTDAMIDRVHSLREIGRVSARGRVGVIAKFAKPQQDIRVDMPTIGTGTVERAATAGLAGIVVEAGRVMLVAREDTVQLADRRGLFIVALGAENVGFPGGMIAGSRNAGGRNAGDKNANGGGWLP